jgi:hypothetical protein
VGYSRMHLLVLVNGIPGGLHYTSKRSVPRGPSLFDAIYFSYGCPGFLDL